MSTILIIGGYGYTGKLLAKHLLAQTDYDVIIAGRNAERAQTFADELNSPRAKATRADAADPASLRPALQNADLCLVAAPVTSLNPETVIRTCIEAEVDYLDIQYSFTKLNILNSHAGEIKQKNLCFVTEAGYHPGLPSALIRYAASKMDCIESAKTAGYLNMGGGLPYTEAVDELMEGFKDYQAQVFKNGAWTKSSSWDMQKFDFGPELGTRTCYSMFFEELRGLPEMYPTLKETGFYISGSNWFTDAIITPIAFIGLKVAPRRSIRPLGRLLWWGMMNLSRPPYRVALKVQAKGQLNGRQVEIQARCEHEDGYELTAIPVVAFLMQYNKVRRPGLHLMGHLAEPVQLFKDMERMGVQMMTIFE
ncbi:MAG: saccharopine dehydrogenase NADP-binding domain-containing protein [Chloroflexi bacterium]|nr:saccharopine dehydrogenase NADP-binding domain-containing protein [Chloroflexota bacterium]